MPIYNIDKKLSKNFDIVIDELKIATETTYNITYNTCIRNTYLVFAYTCRRLSGRLH